VNPRVAVNLAGLVAVVLSVAVGPTFARPAQPRKAEKPAAAPADSLTGRRRVVAYYFHGKARCANCIKIETWSREAIEMARARELADGRLAWKVVDVEVKGNEHFVEDYQLYTKSLVLVEQVGGKQTRWKNCARVWEYLGSKERFLAYVRDEVAGYLKETP
jgi:hypothetical protein